MAEKIARSASLVTAAVLCLGVSVVRAEEMSNGERAGKGIVGVLKIAAGSYTGAYLALYKRCIDNGVNKTAVVIPAQDAIPASDAKPATTTEAAVDAVIAKAAEPAKVGYVETKGKKAFAKRSLVGAAGVYAFVALAVDGANDIAQAISGNKNAEEVEAA